MQSYLIKLCTRPRNDLLNALFGLSVIIIFLFTPCVGLGSDPNGSISFNSDRSAADVNNVAEDVNGPTILLGYSREEFKQNPISSFMYFVPLISPTLVERETSADNEQQVDIISYKRKITARSFKVVCEFEIVGQGFHKNAFDSAGMIASHLDELKKGESLTNMLDYIKFQGEGFGRIEVEGKIKGSIQTVTSVDLQFNARGHKSPVTVGLYDIEPKDRKYEYKNKSNPIVARVNTLSFKRTKKIPRMDIKVASISTKEEPDGFFSGLKGAVVNLFIKPPEVAKVGNEAILDFGYTLLEQKPTFTFPKAKNIKASRKVEIK